MWDKLSEKERNDWFDLLWQRGAIEAYNDVWSAGYTAGLLAGAEILDSKSGETEHSDSTVQECDPSHPVIEVIPMHWASSPMCSETYNSPIRCIRDASHDDGYHISYRHGRNYWWRTEGDSIRLTSTEMFSED